MTTSTASSSLPMAASARPLPAPRHSRWWRVMLVLALLGSVLLGLALWGVYALQHVPVHINFDGFDSDGWQDWEQWQHWDLAALPVGDKIGLVLGLAVALLVVVLVVPMVVLLAIGGVLLGLLLGLGIPLLVLLAIGALLFSPLLLVGWGLWALLRGKPAPVAYPSAPTAPSAR